MFNRDISRPREEKDPCVVLGRQKSRAGSWGLLMILCQPCSNHSRRNIFCASISLEMGRVVSLSH